jgi:AmmeMemoRadiSam system protein B
VVVNDASHALEHSLEVQLPFLQTVLAEFTLVPLAVGHASPAQVAEVLECLWGGDETLLVISSDLSHYLPYALARQTDGNTARHIVALDPHLDHQQACGATPVNGLLLAARRHGLQAQLIDLRNSGDTAGERSRVVGYGAFTFTAKPGHGTA